ncbi:MAG: type II toxin-antitoxin system RelB/DinJ family antitoxin [Eubacterium sp.]|nr:type II toxin-antitoxin system RelB/DinJ family antitoxin [Eubacterium sp.]
MRNEYSTMVEASVNPELREQAEGILLQLGMSASTAITLFYRQIVIQRGLPFEIKTYAARPAADSPVRRIYRTPHAYRP